MEAELNPVLKLQIGTKNATALLSKKSKAKYKSSWSIYCQGIKYHSELSWLCR